VMIFQQIKYGCPDDKGVIAGERDKEGDPVRPFTCAPGEVGRVDSFDYDWGWRRSGRFTGINGKVQPSLDAAMTGAFERWRLINAGTGENMRMRLYRLNPSAPALRTVKAEAQIAWRERYCVGPALPMWQLALDGLTRSALRRIDQAVLFPGERMDVITQLPQAGLYCMVNDTGPDNQEGNNPSRMIAVIAAKGGAAPGAGSDAMLVAALVQSAERALAGRARAPVRDGVIADLKDGMKLSSFTWHKPIPDKEVSGYREVILNIVGGPDETAFRVNGRTYDHDRIDAVLPLGKAEEWRTIALIEDHPLHIHVNPFQIVSIKDAQERDVTDPNSAAFDADYAGLNGEWMDTVMLKKDLRIIFRTRYERFAGDFVTHCHIMYHGDHGMMQNLRIAAEGAAPPPAPGAHPH
jgi:L-ascorbate oxidase